MTVDEVYRIGLNALNSTHNVMLLRNANVWPIGGWLAKSIFSSINGIENERVSR